MGAHLDFADGQLNHPEVAPWHGGSRPRSSVESMLIAQAEQAQETGYCLWWWRERAGGELVGYTGLNRDQVEGEPAVEVGWSITPSRWGEGFAPEAAAASLAWGFRHAGLEEIVAFALPDNSRSIRVMEKIGMSFRREIDRRELRHVLFAIRSG